MAVYERGEGSGNGWGYGECCEGNSDTEGMTNHACARRRFGSVAWCAAEEETRILEDEDGSTGTAGNVMPEKVPDMY